MIWIKTQLNKFKKWIILATISGVVLAGTLTPDEELIRLNKINAIVDTVIVNAQEIDIRYTDNNDNEDFIIKTDHKDYFGSSVSDVFTSITNLTDKDQNVAIALSFPAEQRRIRRVDRFAGNETTATTTITKWEERLVNSVLPAISTARKDTSNYKEHQVFPDFLKAGETAYYKITIEYPWNVLTEEFFIEVFGSQVYGHLDPTYTAVNQAQIDTANYKFGGASGLFDGTSDYLTTPDDAAWNLGAGNWTIDLWVYHATGTRDYQDYTMQQGASVNNFLIRRNETSGVINILLTNSAASWSFNVTTTEHIPNGAWTHVALIRNGDVISVYKNGTAMTLSATAFTGTMPDINALMYIGSEYDTAEGWFNGWIDEFRISKGIARWTSNFTPDTVAYFCPDAYTVTLLHMDGADASTTFTDDYDSTVGCAPAYYDLHIKGKLQI